MEVFEQLRRSPSRCRGLQSHAEVDEQMWRPPAGAMRPQSECVSLRAHAESPSLQGGLRAHNRSHELIQTHLHLMQSSRSSKCERAHTEVSELMRRTNLFDLGSMISSVRRRWGRGWTLTRRETSPWRSWKRVPALMGRDRRVSQIRAQPCTSRCSRSF